MTHELASKTKAWTTLRGRETVALGRELLGGNGIVSDFLVSSRPPLSPFVKDISPWSLQLQAKIPNSRWIGCN